MHRKKLEGSLEKFLSKPENRETECQENVGVASTSAALNLEVMEVSEERNISPLEEDFSKTKTRESTAEEPESNLLSSISSCLDCGDVPGLWPASITNDLVNILVSRGPVQLFNYNFPANDDGRKFANSYYSRNLPNGEKINREWLVYSTSKIQSIVSVVKYSVKL
ncbi:Zinc finger MYM-type protein 5 [Eumeta japonica]|uniref:Zinc finger MYM-type protein 5 n=1 Tax=Eumeta variegata TaxID=151549 RepID=A0A4C1TE52_EUMVA|nr:Zinc finger MYM-type protein 5 [Eumeta japonica]